jgi:hypothetical protein
MANELNNDQLLQIHLTNYRLAFDAMRAYHSSEIEHKKDMISILNGIFVSIITVFAGIAYFILAKDYDKYHSFILLFILAVTALYIIMILRLKSRSIAKIASDNTRYEQFREECRKEREYLQLNTFFSPDATYWEMPSILREGTGHEVTQGIVGDYSTVLISIIICLSTFALALLSIKLNYFHL